SLAAKNLAQSMSLRFDSSGLAVASTSNPKSTLRLRTAAIGRGSQRVAIQPVLPTAQGDSVEFAHGDIITEWYHNRADGVEHGYTLREAPAGSGEVQIELAVGGNFRAHTKGKLIALENRATDHTLLYRKLLVTDAAGVALPAKMEGDGSRIVLAFDDNHA